MSIENLNSVDFIIENLANLTFEDKLKIKNMGPDRPNVVIVNNNSKASNRKFNKEWFTKKTWLTASLKLNRLFCFPCVLFGGDSVWTRQGYNDMKHLSAAVTRHELSAQHIDNNIQLKCFGKVNIAQQVDTAYKRELVKYNKLVDGNRYVLGKILDVIKICGSCELALRGHDEKSDSDRPGVFRTIFESFCKSDPTLDAYYARTPIFKGTSNHIQNDLLKNVYAVYKDFVYSEIQNTNFISIEADETTDISNKSQFVVIFRYIPTGNIKSGEVVERFISYIPIQDRSANGLARAIKELLQQFNVTSDKLIAQTYDGAAVMSGNKGGVQSIVKQDFPHAHFVHCYAHKLNLIIQSVCAKEIPELRIFFANLSGIPSFFSSAPKRMDKLMEICDKRLPRPSTTRWNFQSRTINVIYEKIEHLKECMEVIQNDSTSDMRTVREASGFLSLLNNVKFNTMLRYFSRVMPQIDILYNILQKRTSDAVSIHNAIKKFNEFICKFREEVDAIVDGVAEENLEVDRARTINAVNLKRILKEACDVIRVHIADRFTNSEYLLSSQVLDCTQFEFYAQNFPSNFLNIIMNLYPFLDKERLKTELQAIYRQTNIFACAKTINEIVKTIYDNNLEDIFQEVLKLSEIIITTPMSNAEPERCFSTLKRVKSYLRSTMTEERLNDLAVLSIERSLIDEIDNFNNKVIDRFAAMKERRADFTYKIIK